MAVHVHIHIAHFNQPITSSFCLGWICVGACTLLAAGISGRKRHLIHTSTQKYLLDTRLGMLSLLYMPSNHGAGFLKRMRSRGFSLLPRGSVVNFEPCTVFPPSDALDSTRGESSAIVSRVIVWWSASWWKTYVTSNLPHDHVVSYYGKALFPLQSNLPQAMR